MPVVNREFFGTVTATADVPLAVFAAPANRTLTVTCVLNLSVADASKEAVATAATPQNIVAGAAGNWDVVATGSVVKWTQAVTFPVKSAAP